eukprot:6177610-Pleurochrysis_carterae.AAC.1
MRKTHTTTQAEVKLTCTINTLRSVEASNHLARLDEKASIQPVRAPHLVPDARGVDPDGLVGVDAREGHVQPQPLKLVA